MIDPSALYQGAFEVYGQAEMDRSYGRLLPVDAVRVVASSDGMIVKVGTRTLECIDTPGHARHHHCVWDQASRGWFTGDTFGLSYPEFDGAGGRYLLPTTTPVQFEPEALKRSVARLLEREPHCMYLTHYGRVTDVARLATLLTTQVDAMVDIARGLAGTPQRHERLKEALGRLYREQLAALGSTLPAARVDELLALDVELNAQGLAVWLDRPARSADAAAAKRG